MGNLPPAPQEGLIRVVLIGDIVGKPGLKIAVQAIPWFQKRLGAKVVVANAENSADGSGITIKDYEKLVAAGVSAITLGDHIYRKKEIIEVLKSRSNIVRPANYPKESPGKRWCSFKIGKEAEIAIVSLQGRVFMRPVDCPFAAADEVLSEIPPSIKLRLIDFHAEATSDKQVMGRYLDGRVTAVLGTHTHVTTADDQIFPGGTAFQCDVGMTGPFYSILGRKIEPVLETTLHFEPTTFHVASDDVRISATWVDADPKTGKAIAIGRLSLASPELE